MKQLGVALLLIATTMITNPVTAGLQGRIHFTGEIVEVPCTVTNATTTTVIQCERVGYEPEQLHVKPTNTYRTHYIDNMRIQSDKVGKDMYTITFTVA